jgi:two-component system NarL family sensor kinase
MSNSIDISKLSGAGVELLTNFDKSLLECSPGPVAAPANPSPGVFTAVARLGGNRSLEPRSAALRWLVNAQESTARRIAHSLHDGTSQLLATVHMAIEAVARDLKEPERARLQTVHTLLDQIEEELVRVAHDLRPSVLDNLGLSAALDSLAEVMSSRRNTRISVLMPDGLRLAPAIETVLYRTVAEAVNNATRHGKATLVSVHIQHLGNVVTCGVRDDGVGFDVGSISRKKGRGFGLTGMGERLTAYGGNLSISSSPGHGTEILATIPLDQPEDPCCQASPGAATC